MQNHTSYLEISKKNLLHNFSVFRKITDKKAKVYSVVKSNAYGCGMLKVAQTLEEKKSVNGFCVTSAREGVILRESNIKSPIFCLGFVAEEELENCLRNEIDLIFYRLDLLKRFGEIAKANKKVAQVFLKVETGTSRQGILKKDLRNFLTEIKNNKNLNLKGISTHFANIEDTTDRSYAEFQLKNFKEIEEKVRSFGFLNIKKSIAASAAALLFPETHFDLVRVGIAGYGLWPSNETLLSFRHQNKEKKIELKPVLSWKSKIAQIKEVPEETSISYGCTFKTTRKTKIGIIPVGYFEGYSRLLSGKSYVLARGKKAQVLGRICMNMMVVDFTDIPDICENDEVILIGRSGDKEISVDFLARNSDTINYEFISRINSDISRRVV